MPTAGRRDYISISFEGRGTFGYYWSSSPVSTSYASALKFGMSDITNAFSRDRSYGNPVRCLMDNPVTVTFNPNGGSVENNEIVTDAN